MADTVTFQTTVATPPDGTVIATDDAGAAGQVQIVKLAIATDGSATAIPADASGLLVKSATAANLNMTEASAAAIKTAVEVLDNAISGTEMQVDVVAALPAGTNAIGKLAANSGVDIGDVDVLTLPAKKKTYAASSNLDVTSLNGLAASATHVAGWESPVIDNSTDRYFRDRITAKITVESASLSAGEIRIYAVYMLDDSTWPDVFDGTQSAETVTDVNVRDAICRLIAVTANDTTASQVYYLNGVVDDAPEKFLLFITQSTGTTLETTGNQVTVKGEYLT